jgi:hypothetical protein
LHRGRIGGGKTGIGQRLFFDETDLPVVHAGQEDSFVVVTDLNSGTVAEDVAKFVREVARIKGVAAADPGGWAEFLSWATRIDNESNLLEEEREYKLRIVANLRAARAALIGGDGAWLALLRKAFSPPNNLTPWNMHDRFLKWCEANPETASSLLRSVWSQESDPRARLDAFVAALPNEVAGPALRITLTSFLLMAERPEEFPIYRVTPFERGWRATGFTPPARGAVPSQVLQACLDFLDRLLAEAATSGLTLRDRLDAQGALWAVVSHSVNEPPFTSWPSGDVSRLLAFRGESRVNCWWVNQGATFAQESEGGYVWAPQKNSAGNALYHWANVSKLRTGQKILHYANGQIRALGIVAEDAVDAPRPDELPAEPWEADGRLAKVLYRMLDKPIGLNQIPEEWRSAELNPFQAGGGVRQGYMFPLSDAFCRKLQEAFPAQLPDLVDGGGAKRTWIFQANPEMFDVRRAIRDLPELSWTIRQHTDEVRVGDTVYLWESGAEAGIIAMAHVKTEVAEYEEPPEEREYWGPKANFEGTAPRVQVGIDRVLPITISRLSLLEHPLLKNLRILKAPQATIFRVTDAEARALRTLLHGQPPEPEGLSRLADELLLEREYLERVQRLLEDKPQAIFYGPPGTGKTYVARKLAQFFAGSDGAIKLVQFHPSYAYEDFVEGYRPTEGGFALMDGPLKEIAAQAEADPGSLYVLIIDEINRGNVAKVFGELYFLLEYRDEAVRMQYSHAPFSLPRNLWIIATMNTADRSIALIDAALRRRFYFVPFFPDEPPVRGLLGRWLQRNKPDFGWVADVVEIANERLADRQAAVGPSYFMKATLTEEWVELIWEHSVIPYLAEQFLGQEEELKRFDLEVLRAAVSQGLGELLEDAI